MITLLPVPLLYIALSTNRDVDALQEIVSRVDNIRLERGLKKGIGLFCFIRVFISFPPVYVVLHISLRAIDFKSFASIVDDFACILHSWTHGARVRDDCVCLLHLSEVSREVKSLPLDCAFAALAEREIDPFCTTERSLRQV